MKVYLLRTEDGRYQFYGGVLEATDDLDPPHHGLHGWFERRRKRFALLWTHADGPVLRTMRRIWDWLHRHIHPEEVWLVRLQSAAAIEVRQPTMLTGEEARAAWTDFLDGRLRRHLPWLVFSIVLCPLTILLTPLPGPNVIGYWFAYRAFRHLMVMLGLLRVRRGRVETTFHPSEALDRPLGVGWVTVMDSGAKGAA